jgi:DnaJ-class molecular chaperone
MNLDFDPTVDHYKVLGVEKNATADEIKKQYRKLAKANHPDSTGGDKKKEARFKEVNTAYEVLGDAKKRAQYDDVRRQIEQGGFRPGPGFGPRPGPGGQQVWDISDLFAQFFRGAPGGRPGAVHVEIDDDMPGGMGGGWPFGGGGRPQQQQRQRPQPRPEPHFESKARASDGSWLTVKGSDVHSDVRLPFQDAILGTTRDVATLDGASTVKIPPGTSSGQKLRLRGKGVIGPTGEAGDHYVTIHIDVPKHLDDDAKRKLHDLVSHLKGQAHRGSDGQGKKPRT